jgi:hypothetical protein
VLATVLALARCPGLAGEPDCGDDGFSVGNSPPALPPGLSVEPEPFKLFELPDPFKKGRFPTGSGVEPVVVLSVPDPPAEAAFTGIATAACGSVGRWAALPVTFNCTDVTEVSVAGTTTCASSSRWADVESISPRLQDAVPSLLPQPKLNTPDTIAGVAARRTVASGTFPPSVQALTTHRAVWPRSMLVWKRWMATQRLTELEVNGDRWFGSLVTTGSGPGVAAVFDAAAFASARLTELVVALDVRAVLDVRAALDVRVVVALLLVAAVCAVPALLAVLSAGAAATFAVPDFAVSADVVVLLLAVWLAVAVELSLAVAVVVVVAVPLADSFDVDAVLAMLAVPLALAPVDADGSGLGEGSTLGLVDRDAPVLGEPAVDDESLLPADVLLFVGLLVSVGVAVLVGVVVLPGVALVVGLLVLLGVGVVLPFVGLGFGVGLLVSVGVGVGFVGVGDGLGDVFSDSHCWLVPLTVASASADAALGALD